PLPSPPPPAPAPAVPPPYQLPSDRCPTCQAPHPTDDPERTGIRRWCFPCRCRVFPDLCGVAAADDPDTLAEALAVIDEREGRLTGTLDSTFPQFPSGAGRRLVLQHPSRFPFGGSPPGWPGGMG